MIVLKKAIAKLLALASKFFSWNPSFFLEQYINPMDTYTKRYTKIPVNYLRLTVGEFARLISIVIRLSRRGVEQRNSKDGGETGRVNLDGHVRPRRCCPMTARINLEFRV